MLATLAATVACVVCQPVHIINQTRLKWSRIRHAERALVIQSRQLRHYWHTPVVRFTANQGWAIVLEPMKHLGNCGCWGYHALGDPPAAVVGVNGDTEWAQIKGSHGKWRPAWQVTLSHELLEMLVDPSGGHPEVCDPVNTYAYLLHGVAVSAFITPRHRRINHPPRRA